jgi:hypothetical protein
MFIPESRLKLAWSLIRYGVPAFIKSKIDKIKYNKRRTEENLGCESFKENHFIYKKPESTNDDSKSIKNFYLSEYESTKRLRLHGNNIYCLLCNTKEEALNYYEQYHKANFLSQDQDSFFKMKFIKFLQSNANKEDKEAILFKDIKNGKEKIILLNSEKETRNDIFVKNYKSLDETLKQKYIDKYFCAYISSGFYLDAIDEFNKIFQ